MSTVSTIKFSCKHYSYVVTHDELNFTCTFNVMHLKRFSMWRAVIDYTEDISLTELTSKG